MRLFIRRVALTVALLTAGAIVLAHAQPRFWRHFTRGMEGHLPIPDVAPALHAAERIGIGAAAIAGTWIAVSLGGRLVGRHLRRADRSRLPGRLGASVDRRRARLAPAAVELLLGRDSLAEPYEVAKLFDGLAGVLRPRTRFTPGALLGPHPLALAVLSDTRDGSVRFVVQVAPVLQPAVIARLRATYRDVDVRPLSDALVPDDRVAVVRLKKRSRWLYALQTTKDFQHSVIESLVQTMHGTGTDACVQLVLTPAPATVERFAARALRRRERALRAETSYSPNEPGVESVVAQKTIKGAVEGVGRALLWFELRVAVPRGRRDIALQLAGVLNEARQDNELRPRVIRVRRRLTAQRIQAGRPAPIPGWWSGALPASEVATLWQLPGARVKGAGLQRAIARQLQAPDTISRQPADALLVDERGPLGIRPYDRRYGYAIIGAAGGGKTSILLRDIGNAARDPSRALILVDPKEDAARDALHLIPRERTVHYLDLGKPYCGMNILALRHLSPQVRADVLIAALRETAGEGSIQARSDELLRASITAVCVVEHTPTLFHVHRMLDPFLSGYRDYVVRELRHHHEVDFLRDYWQRDFPAMLAANARFVAETVNAPRNKLSRFLAVPSLQLLDTHPVQLDLERIIDRREILVVNGSKGAVGEDNATLFGRLLILQLQKTLHQIQRRDRSDRLPVRLIIDEAHNFFTPSFATMLSEGRSASLEAVAAFQYTQQIDDERVKAGIKSLLQNISITRLREFEDARAFAALAMEVFSDTIRAEPDDQRRLAIDPLDIINMPNHRPLNLWLTDGAPQPAFTASTLPIEPLLTSAGAQANAAQHLAEQRRRGWHPHDEGRPIIPPLVWDAAFPILVRDRSVHIDIGAWSGTPDLGPPAGVIVALQAPSGSWQGYQASPDDPTRRRWHITVPADPDTDGWLPAGRYPVRVLVTAANGDQHAWTPVDADGAPILAELPPQHSLVTQVA